MREKLGDYDIQPQISSNSYPQKGKRDSIPVILGKEKRIRLATSDQGTRIPVYQMPCESKMKEKGESCIQKKKKKNASVKWNKKVSDRHRGLSLRNDRRDQRHEKQ